MSGWTMLVILLSQDGGGFSAEYANKESCEAARKVIIEEYSNVHEYPWRSRTFAGEHVYYAFTVVCTPKDITTGTGE